ncbi:MAG: hypothetical protein IJ523_11295 [Succinivibrionaceae bacterium]|nr:hypothetical protein [Succinivibrionaceae bacterium]
METDQPMVQMENGNLADRNADDSFSFRRYVEFRFVSGQNVGAALRLAPGSYAIGNGSDCDVVLACVSKEPVSFRVEISDELTVRACAQEGKSALNDGHGERALAEEPADVAEGARIGAQGEYMVWYANWSDHKDEFMFVSRSEIEMLKQNAVAEDRQNAERPDAQESKQSSADDGDQDQPKSQMRTDEVGEPGEQALEDQKEIEPEKKKSGHGRLILTVAGLAVLLALLIAQNYGYLKNLFFQNENSEIALLENYVKQAKNGKLFFRDRGRIYNIRGVFKNQNDYQAFLDGLPASRKPIELNVRLLSDVLDTIRRTFKMYGLTVTPVAREEHFDVYGYVIDEFALTEIVQKLKKDLPAFDFLDMKFKYRSELETFIARECADAGIDVQLLFARGFLAYRGIFSLNDLSRFDEIRKKTETLVGGSVDFRNAANLSAEDLAEIDRLNKNTEAAAVAQTATASNPVGAPVRVEAAKPNVASDGGNKSDERKSQKTDSRRDFSIKNIVGVTRGPMNFITTKDGNKYFAGAKLPGGYTIVRIEQNYIELEKDGKKEVFKLQ